MFAVIKTGGKQYRVAAEDRITVMSLEGSAGDKVAFGEVLMLTGDGGTQVGAPFLTGASVAGEIVEQTRGPKVIAFKKRRRKNSKRKRGHRQDLTLVRITEILTGGEARQAVAVSADGAEVQPPVAASAESGAEAQQPAPPESGAESQPPALAAVAEGGGSDGG